MSITVKRAETTLEFCQDMELRADWEAAQEAHEAAKRNALSGGDARLNDGTVVNAARAVREIEEQMAAAVVVFRLKALKRSTWQSLGAKNPPRDGSQEDRVAGVDVSTFYDAVAMEPGCIQGVTAKATGKMVEFNPATEWLALADEMTDGQYGEFVTKFIELNRGGSAVPFSRAASLTIRNSEKNSDSPDDSASPTES